MDKLNSRRAGSAAAPSSGEKTKTEVLKSLPSLGEAKTPQAFALWEMHCSAKIGTLGPDAVEYWDLINDASLKALLSYSHASKDDRQKQIPKYDSSTLTAEEISVE